ncbi:MAG TPA: hypothetical protein VMH02_06750, partial [Verrucomicrobiae bacterium]|nr:hypothetical protein [Verrucomicrobiae bacterium]
MSGQADPGVLASRYDALRAEIARAATEGAVGRAIARWRALREPWMEWRDRAELAVRLDATDERARATAAEAARRAPALERLDVAVKTALGAKPQQLLGSIGEHTLALWRGDAAINPPAAEPELVEEKRLYRRYF